MSNIQSVKSLFMLSVACLILMGAGCNISMQEPQTNDQKSEQAVLIRVPVSDRFGTPGELQEVYDFEDSLTEVLEGKELGDVDGHDIGEGEAIVYLYGPDADELLAAIEPTLRASRMAPSMQIKLRYGSVNDPDAREVYKDLKD